jgi:hypothetical protein
MAVANGFGKVATSGSVFMYDTGDTRNSYKGEPTTNLLPNGVAEGHNSGGYGNVVTVTDATIEKGPGWKKVTISNRGSNFRIIQWTYITMSANITYCHSAEFDWGNMRDKGYFIYFDGNGTGGRTYYRPGNYSSAGSEQINSTMPDGKFAGTILHTATHTHAFFIGNYSTSVSGLNDYFYYKEFQVEINSHPTQYTTGTRSSTQGLLPIVSNSTIDLSNVSFDSAAQKIFDGTDDRILLTNFTNKPTTAITCEAIIKPTRSSVGTGTIRGGAISATNTMYLGIIDSVDGGNTFAMHWANQTVSSRVYNWNGQIPNNAYSHLVGTYDGSTARAYLNGVEIWSTSQTGNIPDADYYIGTYGGSPVDGVHNFIGYIPVAKMYNRALSSAEVLQNYNKYKTRFNLS